MPMISTACPPGPALLQAMLQSDPESFEDLSAPLWRRAAGCDWQSIGDPAAHAAISQFQEVARDNGLAAGLRTFALNGNFRLYFPGLRAMDLGAADKYLNRRPWAGNWREGARGSSPDAALLYAVGDVALTKGPMYRYAQVWQFDPKVANWGLRLLLLRPPAKN